MYLIIGQGAAGVSAAVALKQLDNKAPVTVITQEADYYYNRIDLPDIIAGKLKPEMAMLRGPEGFSRLGIECRMSCPAAAIYPEAHSVTLVSGEVLSYSKLLLATGSQPIIPPIKGSEGSGVYSLWNMEQARQIIAAAGSAQTAVVIGAGLIGLKTALALAKRGLKVTVVEKLPRVMPRQLDDQASAIVAKALREQGIYVLTGVGVEEIIRDGNQIRGVRIPEGVIFADLVIVSVGVKPNTSLAAESGIRTSKGIQADPYMKTSAPDIFVAGDAAEVTNALTGCPIVPAIWPEAVRQGQVAAANMAGRRVIYEPGTAMNSVEVAGVPLVSVGEIEAQDTDQVYTYQQADTYRKVIVRNDIVAGVLCLSDIRHAGVLGNLVLRKAKLDRPEMLVQTGFSYARLAIV